MPLINQLNTLETTGLIRLAAVQPELEYLFRHALVQDAAYGSLLKNDRRQLHQSVGESLERLYPDQLDELAATLAYHFEKAQQLEKAVHYLTRAGDRASQGFANAEALGFYQSAIDQAEQAFKQTSNAQWTQQLSQHFEKMADVQERMGQHETARATYYRALEAQARLAQPDNVMQARLYRKIATTHTLQRQFADAARAHEQAGSYLGELSNPQPNALWEEWIELNTDQVMYYYWQTDPSGMKQVCDRLLPVVEQIGTPLQRSNALYGHYLYSFHVHRYVVSDEVMDKVEENIQFAEQTVKLGAIFDHHFTAGFFHFFRRELDEGESHLHRCLELAERMGDPVRISRAANYLMLSARMRGQVERTQSYFETVLSTTWAGPMADYTFTVQGCQAWIAWRAGRLDEAQAFGLAAREKLLGPFRPYPFQWIVYFPLIAVAVAKEQLAEAIEYVQSVLDPTQMILPEDLTTALKGIVEVWEAKQFDSVRQSLTDTLKLATKYSYL